MSLSYNEILKRIDKNLLHEPRPKLMTLTREERKKMFIISTMIGDMC